MPDNGYGAKTNSEDFLLRMYKIRPDFKTAAGRTGPWPCWAFCSSDPDQKSRSWFELIGC